MAEIVDLAIERGYRQSRQLHEQNPGPAQIVLYTGIRYERAGPPSGPKPKRRKSKKKKNKNG